MVSIPWTWHAGACKWITPNASLAAVTAIILKMISKHRIFMSPVSISVRKALPGKVRVGDPHGFEGASFGVNFYGDKGSMSIAGNDCYLYDLNDKLIRHVKGKHDDSLHFSNFIEGIR